MTGIRSVFRVAEVPDVWHFFVHLVYSVVSNKFRTEGVPKELVCIEGGL